MKAYQLLARLRLLTLSGFKDGEFEWIGTDKTWKSIEAEEQKILEEYNLFLW